MIGISGTQAGYGAGAETPRAAKRADAVGQQAKAVLAAARESGADLPRNAQGLAASAVARGLDAGSLFAARTAPAPAIGPVEVSPEGIDGALKAEPGEVIPTQATGPVEVPQANVATVTGDETASVAVAEAEPETDALAKAEADTSAAGETETGAVTDTVSGPGDQVISQDPALALVIDPDAERATGD